MKKSHFGALLVAVLLFYAVWGLVYVQRTSVVLEGETVYTLWDDAMISMRYAENLRLGYGLRWNPGETPIQGYSNLGVALVMAALHFFPLGPQKMPALFQIFNLGLLLGILYSTWRIGLETFADRRDVAWCALLATALSGPIALWALQGGDTALLSLWLLLVFRGATRPAVREGRWPAVLWLAMALGMVIRVDAAIYCAVFLLESLRLPGAAWRRFATGAAIHAAVFGALVTFSYVYYGDPLPNTYYLKVTGTPFVPMFVNGISQLFTQWIGLLPALALALYATYRFRAHAAVPLAAGLIGVAVAYNVRVGGDWAAQYGLRFVVPVLPLVFVLAAAGCLALLERRVPTVARVAVAVVLLALTNPPTAGREWLVGGPTMFHKYNEQNLAFGRYLARYTHPSTRVAVHWAGIAPYTSKRPAADVLGKSDRHIARLKVDRFEPGHSKWDWRYTIEEQRPDVFLLATRGLAQRDDFRSLYLRAESPGGLVFYVRHDAVDKLTEPGVTLIELE